MTIMMVIGIMLFTVACPDPHTEEIKNPSDVRFMDSEDFNDNYYTISITGYSGNINIDIHLCTGLWNHALTPREDCKWTYFKYEFMIGNEVLFVINQDNYTSLFDFSLNPNNPTNAMRYDINNHGKIEFYLGKATAFDHDPFNSKNADKVKITVTIEDKSGRIYDIQTIKNMTQFNRYGF